MDDVKRKAFFSRISHALGRKEIPTFVAPYPYDKGPQEAMYSVLSHEQVVEIKKVPPSINGIHPPVVKLILTKPKWLKSGLLSQS